MQGEKVTRGRMQRKNARGEKITRGKLRADKVNRGAMRAVKKLPAENYPSEKCAQVPRYIFLPARISVGPRAIPRANPVTDTLLNLLSAQIKKNTIISKI